MWRFIKRSLLVLALLGAVGLGVALWAYRDIPAAELEARYAGPASRFINIDGVRMHYRDEGTGPVVVLFHANFSNLTMREVGGKEYFLALMDAFERHMHDHIEVYGPDNHLRLTGLHETQSIDTFSWGIADRGASIRVPHGFVKNGWRGYLEDRRPNSQGDPYRIAGRIIETISMVDESAAGETQPLALAQTG